MLSLPKLTTKQEALKRFTEEDKQQMEKLIILIENKFNTYSGDPITISPPASISKRVIDKVAKEYETIGWKVQQGSDQRDGSWIKLS